MATTMSFKRLTKVLLSLTAICGSALSTRAGDWIPMLPDQDFYDFQLFAPPDLNEYQLYPEPSEGIFFNYDRLYWGITVPKTQEVARTPTGYLIPTNPISPQTIVTLNNDSIEAGKLLNPPYPNGVLGGLYVFGTDVLRLDLNTSWMKTAMTWGNRYEGGWIYDNRGIEINYFDTGEQSQNFQTNSEFAASSPQQIFTQSQAAGGQQLLTSSNPQTTTTIVAVSPPPDHLIAQKLTQHNTTRVQSAGVAALVRRELGRRGSRSTATFSVGPRFIQFEDRFNLGYESNQYAWNLGGGTTGGTTGGVTGGNSSLGINTSSAGDVLDITGVDTLTGQGAGTPLQTGVWETYTTNNMAGPEFAINLEATSGRWTFSSDLKFTAAFNWQNNLYRGANFPNSLGADYLRTTFTPATVSVSNGNNGPVAAPPQTIVPPPLFLQIYGVGQQNANNSAEHNFVFSPIGEWRFGTQFRVSQSILLRAGYTGMWMSQIARASTNTAYKSDIKQTQYAKQSTGGPTDPPIAVVPVGNWYVATKPTEYNHIGAKQGGEEYVFTNGIDFGVEVKY